MKLSSVNFNTLNYSFSGSKEINQKIDTMKKEAKKKRDELFKSLDCLSNYANGQCRVIIADDKTIDEVTKKMGDVSIKYSSMIHAYVLSPEVQEDVLNELVQAGVNFADAKEFASNDNAVLEYLTFRPGGEVYEDCYGKDEDKISPLLSYLAVKNECIPDGGSFLDFIAMYDILGDEYEAKIYSDKGGYKIDEFISLIDGSEDIYEHDYSVYKPSIISDLLDKSHKRTYFHEVRQEEVEETLLPEDFAEEFQDEIMALATPQERIAYLQKHLK